MSLNELLLDVQQGRLRSPLQKLLRKLAGYGASYVKLY